MKLFKDAMEVFHVSSQRECCILCHGDTAAVNDDLDICECGPGSKPIDNGECSCKDNHLLNDAGDECILCFGLGAQLDVFDKCTCADRNAIVTDNECACNEAENWFLLGSTGECKKCVAGLAELNQETGVCACNTENAVLAADGTSCECDEGYVQTSANTCLMCTSSVGLEAILSDNDKCECPAENAVLVDGECVCEEGFMVFEGTCVECAGPISFVNDDGECACPDGSVLNPSFTCTVCPTGNLIEGTDDCDFTVEGGLFVNGVLTCNADFVLFGEECIKCSGPGAELQSGECVCTASFSIAGEEEGTCICDPDQDAFFTDGICKTCTGPGELIGDVGSYICQCGENAVLTFTDEGFVCQCANEEFLEGDDGNCYMCNDGEFDPSDQSCTCTAENKVLNDDKTACVCDDKYHLSEARSTKNECIFCDTTLPLVSRFEPTLGMCLCNRNALMNDDGECECDNGYKEKGTECVRCEVELDSDGECTCDEIEGTLYWDYDCLPCVGANARIEKGKCTCGQFEELNDDNECVCIEDYEVFESSCIKCTGPGAELDADGNCVCPENAELISGVCGCKDGFLLADDDTCNVCNGGTFDPATKDCVCDVIDFTVLNDEGTDCICDEGYETASTGECIICNTESEFFSMFFNDICHCVDGAVLDDGECACDSGFIAFESTCVQCDTEAFASLDADGLCHCADPLHLYNADTFGCVVCSGLNAELDDAGECVCGVHEELNDDGVCECITDFLPFESDDLRMVYKNFAFQFLKILFLAFFFLETSSPNVKKDKKRAKNCETFKVFVQVVPVSVLNLTMMASVYALTTGLIFS